MAIPDRFRLPHGPKFDPGAPEHFHHLAQPRGMTAGPEVFAAGARRGEETGLGQAMADLAGDGGAGVQHLDAGTSEVGDEGRQVGVMGTAQHQGIGAAGQQGPKMSRQQGPGLRPIQIAGLDPLHQPRAGLGQHLGGPAIARQQMRKFFAGQGLARGQDADHP